MEVDITEFMCFKQDGHIFTSRDKPLKSIEQFTFFKSNIPSTENNINLRIEKVGTHIDRLSIVWKSDHSENKVGFLQSCGLASTSIWMLYLDSNEIPGQKARLEIHKNAVCNKYWRQYLTEQQPYNHVLIISLTISIRQTSYTGYCWENKNKPINDVLLCCPTCQFVNCLLYFCHFASIFIFAPCPL